MSTRAVRLGVLCAGATLVACGRPPEAAAPASAALAGAGSAALGVAIERSGALPAAPGGGEAGASSAQAAAPGTRPPVQAAAGGTGEAPVPGTAIAPPDLSEFPVPKVGEALARPGMDAGAAGDADKAPQLTAPIQGGEELVGVESAPHKRSGGHQALGFYWGGTDVADEVYGYFGNTYANLQYDDYSGRIYGYLDGRYVSIQDASSYLYGSVGYSTVNLRRSNGWFSSKISGTFGGHYVSLSLGSRSLKGYEGTTYLNTSTSWDGRTLSGSYGGYSVKVTDSSGTLSGYFGYKTVRVTSGWSSFSGWVGNKPVNLRSDMASAAFLRRLPLLAADDWMIIGTLTEFFDP